MHDPYAALAPIYDRLVQFDDDVALYRSLADRQGGPVLDVGAGTGRIALSLARAGHQVVALDPSPAMIAVGRAASEAAGLHVSWRRGEAGHGRLGGPYPLIVWGLDGFLHLPSGEAQARALTALRRVLTPDGLLVLDLPSLASWWDWQPGVRPLELTWSGAEAAGRVTLHYETFTCDPAEQTRTVTHIVESVAADGGVCKRVTAYTLRFAGRFELALLLTGARLMVRAEYGDYALGPPDAASERLIVLAGR